MRNILKRAETFLTRRAVVLGSLAALVALGTPLIGLLRPSAPSSVQQTQTGDGGIQIGTNTGTVNQGITPEILEFFEAQTQRELAQQRALLERAHGAEQDVLRAQIADLEQQLAHPEAALEIALKRNLALEARLKSYVGQVPDARIDAAVEALSRFEYDQAEALFAEVEAANDAAVAESARAAYGRGEVAEAQIRWRDAATHYTRAARIAPDFDSLSKAQDFTARAGDYTAAQRLSAELLDLARAEGRPEQIAHALNTNALRLDELGDAEEAEALYREALEIARATIGMGHPSYATHLNNLAGVVKAQGRYGEAEALYREALEIDRATTGAAHPDYASHLNNLAAVLFSQERPAEAVPLFEQALQIFQDRLPPEHPTIATVQRSLDAARARAARAAQGD